MFVIDGLVWDIQCEILRTTEIKASDISGLMLDGEYLNDVLGSYLSYEIRLPAPMYLQGQYAVIYELLSEPVSGHNFTLPYNDSYVTIAGRVERIADNYIEKTGCAPYWASTTFTILANAPSKTLELSEVIERGLPALPDVASPQIGDVYVFTNSGWEKVTD